MVTDDGQKGTRVRGIKEIQLVKLGDQFFE